MYLQASFLGIQKKKNILTEFGNFESLESSNVLGTRGTCRETTFCVCKNVRILS